MQQKVMIVSWAKYWLTLWLAYCALLWLTSSCTRLIRALPQCRDMFLRMEQGCCASLCNTLCSHLKIFCGLWPLSGAFTAAVDTFHTVKLLSAPQASAAHSNGRPEATLKKIARGAAASSAERQCLGVEHDQQ
jgi:hypothetical protein